MMRPSSASLARACRITLFSNPGCALCTTAKETLQSIRNRRPFELVEINIRAPGKEHWLNQYMFDTPVIHVEQAGNSESKTIAAAQKLMHRFREAEVEAKMDTVESCA